MGLSYSTPVPTDADFTVQHKPLPVPALFTTTEYPKVEYSFHVPTKAWKEGASLECHLVGSLKPLLLQVTPVKDNDKQCLVTRSDGTVLAVLKVREYRFLQICTLAKPDESGKAAKVVGDYQGQPLYEYALVAENQHTYHHTLALTGVAGGATYAMKRCGSKCGGPKDVVIKRTDDGTVGAYLTEQLHKMWNCRAAPGVDPALLVAFVVCSDKLRTMFNDMIAEKSRPMQYGYSAASGGVIF